MRRKLHDGLFLVFVALSVVDTFALTSQFGGFLGGLSLKLSLLRYNVGCQLFTWIREFSQVCSSYLLLLSTIERFVSLRFPLKRAILCSGRRIRIAVLCIFVLAPISQVYNLFLVILIGRSCGTPFSVKFAHSVLKIVTQQVMGMILPYCCIAILNMMIVYLLIKYRKQRVALQGSITSSEDRAQRSMTVMLFAASTYSLLLITPSLIERAMNPYRKYNPMFALWTISIIAPWNYCGNFFFYIIGGQQFRKELRRMILCRQSTGKYKAYAIHADLT